VAADLAQQRVVVRRGDSAEGHDQQEQGGGQVSDLVTKVLAAIEQTEHIAQKAIDAGRRDGDIKSQEWREIEVGSIMSDPDGVRIVSDGDTEMDSRVVNHILRQQPRSVLRMCSAHRDIVEHAQSALELVDDEGAVITDGEVHIDRDTYEAVEDAAGIWSLTLALLADAYGIEEGS
jgi:Family of unknown function (DUF6221)